MALSRRIVAEGLGTAFLLAAVVGSGIMGEKLAGGKGFVVDLIERRLGLAGIAVHDFTPPVSAAVRSTCLPSLRLSASRGAVSDF
jgi:hypothetical protein